MSKRVLFVDDEKNILNGLRRMLRAKRNDWELHFVDGGKEALEFIRSSSVDVVVSDMQMPGMDGAELLSLICGEYPNTIRIILSGYTDQEAVLRTIGPAHQYLAKPCDREILIETIQHSIELRKFLGSDELRGLVSGLKTLPTLTSVFSNLIQEISSEEADSSKIARIIESDVSLAANILKLTNSAYFGLASDLTSPLEAVQRLGLETIKAIVLVAGAFQPFQGSSENETAMKTLSERSLAIGLLARRVAVSLNLSEKVVDHAYIAGTLSHVGTLLLISKYGKAFRNVVATIESEGISILEAEKKVLGSTHGELGAYLLGLWGFVDPIVEAVAHHHEPNLCKRLAIGPLTCVHIAQELARPDRPDEFAGLDEAYLEDLGIASRLSDWMNIAQEIRESASV